jgi:hypothetical protein
MRLLLIEAIVSSQAFAEDYKPDAENGAFLLGDHCVDCHMVDSHQEPTRRLR